MINAPHKLTLILTDGQREELTKLFRSHHGNMKKVFSATIDAIIELGKKDKIGLMIAAAAYPEQLDVFELKQCVGMSRKI